MNDTPETDAFFFRTDIDWDMEVEFARRLERELKAERALADRLADAIQSVMLDERDLPVASCRGFIDFDQAVLAVEQWKGARSE